MKRKITLYFALMICTLLMSVSPALSAYSDAFDKLFAPAFEKINRSRNYVTDYYPLTRYTNLKIKLYQIQERSHGLINLEVIGQSTQKRDIYLAKVGDPSKTPVMIVTQQHGDEPLPTEAALKLLEELSWGDANAKSILDHLYVLIVVRANPDGSEVNSRYTVNPMAPAKDKENGYYTSEGVGYDMNRYHYVTGWEKSLTFAHNPEAYSENPVPESVAIINAYQTYKPIWMADFHHQGSYVTTEGDDVTSSVLWPHNEGASEHSVTMSKQLCMAMADLTKDWGYAYITQYTSGISTYPGICRNGYGIAGIGSILVEIKSYTGRESKEIYIDHAYKQMKAILSATATGGLQSYDISDMDSVVPPADIIADNDIKENRIYYTPTAPNKPDTVVIDDDTMKMQFAIERNGSYYNVAFEHQDGLFWHGTVEVLSEKPESMMMMDDYFSVEVSTAKYKGVECEFLLRFSHGDLWELDPGTFKIKPGNFDHDYTNY